jgi:hypothetical protein
MGAIKEPTGFKAQKGLEKAPKIKPTKEYVWGVRAKDTRNNVRFTSDVNKIVYHTAAIGIVLDIRKEVNSQ